MKIFNFLFEMNFICPPKLVIMDFRRTVGSLDIPRWFFKIFLVSFFLSETTNQVGELMKSVRFEPGF